MQSPLNQTPGIQLLQWIKNHQWFILVGVASIAFFLGCIGFHRSFQAAGMTTTPYDLIYLSIQLFVLQSGTIIPVAGWELQVARFLAPALTFYSIIIFLLLVFQERGKRFFLRFARDHVIICGGNAIGSSLSKNFNAAGYKVVTVDSRIENSGKGSLLSSHEMKIYEDPTDTKILSELSIENARFFFAVEDDDGLNIEISSLLQGSMNIPRLCPLYCFIHLNNPDLTTLFREKEIFSESNKNIRTEYFNIYQLAGWLLFRDRSPFPGDSGNLLPVHVVIVGLGRTGESVLIQLVKKWRNNRGDSKEKIVITVIDRIARKKILLITAKYRSLTEYTEIIPLDLEIESPEFLDGHFLMNSEHFPSLTMIYCCFGDETLNLLAALEIQKSIKNNDIRKDDGTDIPIVVRTSYLMGFNRMIKEKNGVVKEYGNILPFPFFERTCSPDVILYSDFEMIAKAIHEGYLFQQLKAGRMMDADDSDPKSPMKSWEMLSESLKASNREQATDIRNKLTMIGCEIVPATRWDDPLFEFTKEELEKLSIQEHTRWMEEKIRNGWTFGQVRDNERKIHHCLVPWEELPEYEKEKDRDAVRAIPLLLQKVDLSIRRMR